jgi:hypothetical protein
VLALDVIKTKYYEKEIPREILNGLKQFHERMLEVRNTFIQRGYGGLVPRSVRNNIEDLQVHLSMAIGILEKRKEFSKLTPAEKKNIFDKLYRLCEDLQNRIRRLLNVNALDIK